MINITLATLRKNTSFRSVMNKGQKWITPGFIVFLAPQGVVSEKGAGEQTVLKGVVASKKVGNAVIRNRAKRRLREVIRLYEGYETIQGMCVVLIARSDALILPFEKMQGDLKWALRKISEKKT